MGQTAAATGWAWVRDITRYQWMIFLIAWLGWSLDNTDFNLFSLVLRPAIDESPNLLGRLVSAEENVRRLQGVVGVSNQIAIKPQVNTANISNDISCALHRSSFPDPDAITVTAEGGKVRLTGNVHSWHARDVAGQTAWGAPGTSDVENLLAVI